MHVIKTVTPLQYRHPLRRMVPAVGAQEITPEMELKMREGDKIRPADKVWELEGEVYVYVISDQDSSIQGWVKKTNLVDVPEE